MHTTHYVFVLLVFVLFVCPFCLSQNVSSQCHTFQSLPVPTPMPKLYRCGHSTYKNQSCCSLASAKRAYNWVYEDDGCGVVAKQCAVLMADLACATNCADNLVVTGINYDTTRLLLPGKVVVCASYAKKLYDACVGYAWCGTQQQFTTDCKMFAITGTKSGAKLSIVSALDTCTFVAELNPSSFAENILGLVVHEDDDSNKCVTPISVPYVGAASSLVISWASIIMLAALALFNAL